MLELLISSLADLPSYKEVGYTHIVSLLDANYIGVLDRGPFMPEIVYTGAHLFEGYHPHQRLERQFDDVSHPTRFYKAPSQEDVEAILTFGKVLDPAAHKVLVHCVAGISRSSAAATLLLLQAHPEQTADQIFDEIVRIRRQASPNSLMLEIGGDILGRKDELLDAYKRRFSALR
jgi:predicted protein tyrosine phosphatase